MLPEEIREMNQRCPVGKYKLNIVNYPTSQILALGNKIAS